MTLFKGSRARLSSHCRYSVNMLANKASVTDGRASREMTFGTNVTTQPERMHRLQSRVPLQSSELELMFRTAATSNTQHLSLNVIAMMVFDCSHSFACRTCLTIYILSHSSSA